MYHTRKELEFQVFWLNSPKETRKSLSSYIWYGERDFFFFNFLYYYKLEFITEIISKLDAICLLFGGNGKRRMF